MVIALLKAGRQFELRPVPTQEQTTERPQMARTQGKAPPVDLANTRAKWDGIDMAEADLEKRKAAIEKAKWEIARDLWTANVIEERPPKQIAELLGRSDTLIRRWVQVWARRAEFRTKRLTFSAACQEVNSNLPTPKERSRHQEKLSAERYVRRAGVDEKADLAADLLEDDKVARAVQKVVDKRHKKEGRASETSEKVGALGMTPSELKGRTKELQENRRQRYKEKHGPDAEPPSAAEQNRQAREAGRGPKLSPEQENQDDLGAAIHWIAEEVSTIKKSLEEGARIELVDEDDIDGLHAAVEYLQTVLKGSK